MSTSRPVSPSRTIHIAFHPLTVPDRSIRSIHASTPQQPTANIIEPTQQQRPPTNHGLQPIKIPPGRPIPNSLPMPSRRLPARQKDSEKIPKSVQEASQTRSTQQVRRCDDKWRHHVCSGVCIMCYPNLHNLDSLRRTMADGFDSGGAC